jgi:peptide/nickel transport system substrate-binding protein
VRSSSTVRSTVVALVVATVAASAVVASALGANARHAKLDTVVMRATQDWQTFDWNADAGRATTWAIVAPAYDKLVSMSAKGAKAPYVPYLATSWKKTAKSVTFKLRKDAKCSDGHVLTASDVRNAVQYFLDAPKRSGSVESNSNGGFGKGPFHLSANNKTGTFTFASDSAYRNFIGTFAGFPIVCPAGLAAVKSDPRALETGMYGSGPYTLVSAEHGNQIVFKLRPEWMWGPKGTSTKTLPTNLLYKVVSDDTTAANQLLTGQMNYAFVQGQDVDRLNASSQLVHTIVPNFLVLTLVFNERPGTPFYTDKLLRQGLATAVDPAKFNAATYDGKGTVATSIFRPGSECFDPKTKSLVPTPSIDKARQILAQDGWQYTNGKLMKNGQQLKLRINLTPLMNSGPEYIASVYQQLGADVDLSNVPGPTYGTNMINGFYDISIIRSTTVSNDAGAGQFPYVGDPTPQGSNYANAGADDPKLEYYQKASFQNASCKYFALWQESLLQGYHLRPLVAPNLDVYATKGVTVPALIPDAPGFAPYWIKVS